MASMMTTIPSSSTSTTSTSSTAAIFVTVVLSTEPATVSATAPSTASIVATLIEPHGLQPAGQLLVALHNQLHQVLGEVPVLLVEEGSGQTKVAHSASSPDSVDVLLNVSRHVEVDHVLHVGNVEAPRGYRSCHNDWCLANFEPSQSLFSFSLSAVTVNAGDRETLPVKELIEAVSPFLCLHKDKSPAGLAVEVFGTEPRGVHQVEQERPLVVLLDPHDLLGDVLGGGANATNSQENVVAEEVASQHLNLFGKSGGEHHGLSAILGSWHVVLLDNSGVMFSVV